MALTVLGRSSSALANNGSTFSGFMNISSLNTSEKKPGDFGVLRGMMQSDVNGVLEIFFASTAADAQAALPAIGAASAVPFVRLIRNLVGGGSGLQVAESLGAPFVAFRFTNNSGGAQASFRIHLEVAD